MTGKTYIPYRYVNDAGEMSRDSQNHEHRHGRSNDLRSMHHGPGPVNPTTTIPTDYHISGIVGPAKASARQVQKVAQGRTMQASRRCVYQGSLRVIGRCVYLRAIGRCVYQGHRGIQGRRMPKLTGLGPDPNSTREPPPACTPSAGLWLPRPSDSSAHPMVRLVGCLYKL